MKLELDLYFIYRIACINVSNGKADVQIYLNHGILVLGSSLVLLNVLKIVIIGC